MNQIQTMIESLHSKQRCPRLHVDTTRPGVVCPDFLREQWKEQLVIDLDPSYPLDLAFTEVGVEADLSFGGYVTRCVFPWAAIYVVVDRETSRGLVIETAVPASLRAKQAAAKPKPKPKLVEVGSVPEDTASAKVSSDKGPRKSRRNRRKKPGEAETDVNAEAETDVNAEAETDVKPEAEASTREEEVRRRRAAFKVIDSDD